MIAVIGLGVIGGSYAMGLKEAGYTDVFGLDSNPETIKKALERGIIDHGSVNAGEILPLADMVILAIYPSSVVPFLREHVHEFKSGALLTDATGIKGVLIQEIEKILPADIDFVPGHPMAGREKMGIDFATNTVFKNANYIITPLERNSDEHVAMIEEMAFRLGFKRVTKIDPHTHDELIAYTSQLPHAMAVALVNSDIEGRETGRFTGDSYRALTRIAKINAPLWSELFYENRENLLAAMDSFSEELARIRRCVAEGNLDELTQLFEKSTARREAIDD